MTHKEKLNKMFAVLPKQGINKYTFAPPIYRLLWKIGIEIPPPLFSTFTSIFLFMGIFFGTLWELLTWLIYGRNNLPLSITMCASILAGILFGLSMAIYCRYQAKKHSLPLWKDYGSD